MYPPDEEATFGGTPHAEQERVEDRTAAEAQRACDEASEEREN